MLRALRTTLSVRRRIVLPEVDVADEPDVKSTLPSPEAPPSTKVLPLLVKKPNSLSPSSSVRRRIPASGRAVEIAVVATHGKGSIRTPNRRNAIAIHLRFELWLRGRADRSHFGRKR